MHASLRTPLQSAWTLPCSARSLSPQVILDSRRLAGTLLRSCARMRRFPSTRSAACSAAIWRALSMPARKALPGFPHSGRQFRASGAESRELRAADAARPVQGSAGAGVRPRRQEILAAQCCRRRRQPGPGAARVRLVADRMRAASAESMPGRRVSRASCTAAGTSVISTRSTQR